MALVRAICFVSFVAASLAIGLRLLWLVRRSRQLPELLIAVMFLSGGVAGYGLVMLFYLGFVPPDWTRVAQLTSILFIDLAVMCMALFTFRVFRPEEPLALLGIAAPGLLVAMGLLGALLSPMGDPAPVARELSFWGTTTGTLFAYAWGAIESFGFYAIMRRRTRLGLGDRLVTNRLLLWGIGAAASALISAVYVAAHLSGQQRALRPTVGIVSALLILVSAVANWLAFFPPAAYRRLLEPTRSSG